MSGTFELFGTQFKYDTRRPRERRVEVPVGALMLSLFEGANVLEFGNVMKGYGDYDHDVLDKREGNIYEDIVAWKAPVETYDLVLSISTIEHVGHLEVKFGEQFDPLKHRRALWVLNRALKPGGVMLLSWPVGWNWFLDNDVRSGLLDVGHLGSMRRVADKVWVEEPGVDWSAGYYYPFRGANVVVFAITSKALLATEADIR